MKTVISLMALIACALPLDAQITASIDQLPGGLQQVRIRNDSEASLVAFAVRAKPLASSLYSGGPSRYTGGPVYFDTEMDEGVTVLPANQGWVVMGGAPGAVFIGRLRFEEPMATAGIFADGSTTGDALMLSQLLMRRRSILLAVETALETLDDAGREGASRYQLIARFKKMTESLHRWYLGPDQQIGLLVYQPILGSLVNMQGVREGAVNPLAVFLDDTTAALRRQRIRLSESQPSLAMLH